MRINSKSASNKANVQTLAILSLALSCPITTFAAENPDFSAKRSGFVANTSVKFTRDNNILRLGKNDEFADSLFTLAPKATFASLKGKQIFAVQYEGEFNRYTDNSIFDNETHIIKLGTKLDHSLRFKTEFGLKWQSNVERPGTTDAIVAKNRALNEIDYKSLLARAIYGRNTSKGQLILGYLFQKQTFNNNQQQTRNNDLHQLTGTFFYRIAPKTRLLFEIRLLNYDYTTKRNFPAPSSNSLYYLIGTEWAPSSKLSGSFRIGQVNRNYDSAIYNDISSLSYFSDIKWKPNTYTLLKLAANRTTSESTLINSNGFISNSLSLDLEHAFTKQTRLLAGYKYLQDDKTYSQNRTDKRNDLLLGIKHNISTWLNAGLNIRSLNRSSSIDTYDFSARQIELTLATQFD